MYNFLPAVNFDQNEKKKRAIRQLIKKYKISCLTHFTRVDYLKSILQFGILPLSILKHNKTFDFVTPNIISNPPEWNGLVSLNVSFPDYKLFNEINEHKLSDWVILLIDPQILVDFPCYFFKARALKVISQAPFPNISLLDYQAPSDFKNLFTDHKEVKRRELEIPSFYTTDPTSEILCSFPIGAAYITQVYFHSDYKFNQWVLHNTEFAMTQDRSRWAVGLEYFSPRMDYPFWKTLRKP